MHSSVHHTASLIGSFGAMRIRLWLPMLIGLIIFITDIGTPHGPPTAIGYILLIFSSLWLARVRDIFVLAAVCSCLMMIAVICKSAGKVPADVAITNRGILAGAVLFIAAMIYLYRRSHAAFRQSESRLRAVVDHAADGLIAIDARGIVEDFNPACERIFGYAASEVRGRNIKILMPEPYHSEHDGYLAHYHATGEARIIGTLGREVIGRRKDGSVFPMELAISTFELENGRHFSGIVRDITARKAAEAELMRYTSALERSNQDLDDFAYIASHDLKEPLRGLARHAQFLREDYHDRLDSEGEKRLQRIQFLSQRLDRLIGDLLYFSRLGRQTMAAGPADLSAIVHEIAASMEATFQRKNATISVSGALPSVVCDRVLVAEIFRNLIANAVKYNNSHHKLVEIGCLDAVITKDGVERQVYYVKDNGIGIEEQFFEEIFRIFKRLNDENDNARGDGVGLTFVRKIVLRHGGRIWLESTPGQGTTFYFTLGHTALDVAA